MSRQREPLASRIWTAVVVCAIAALAIFPFPAPIRIGAAGLCALMALGYLSRR